MLYTKIMEYLFPFIVTYLIYLFYVVVKQDKKIKYLENNIKHIEAFLKKN